MVHKYISYGANEPETIEVGHEQIAAGLPVLLHVRRGSESALNQLLTDPASNHGDDVHSPLGNEQTKRWSAAAPLSQESKERFIPKRDDRPVTVQKKWTYMEEDENEERDVFPVKRNSGFLRDGSSRLSMQFIGDAAGGLKWVEAADRVGNNKVFSLSLPRDHRRKEPLCQANSNPVSSPSNDVRNQYENSTDYIVLKMDNEALGIHVVPDYDNCGRDRGLLVQRIEGGGKVDRDGRLSVCDRIVEINDKNLLNQPFNTVQEIFRDSLRCPELRMRVIKHQPAINGDSSISPVKKSPPPPVYPKPSYISPKYTQSNKENVIMIGSEQNFRNKNTKMVSVSPTRKVPASAHASGNILMAVNTRKIGKKVEIELIKGTHGLGFSITTRDNPVGGNCPVYIKNILPKGAAVEDGHLKCGDRLLSVNGNDVTGKSQSEIVSELRNVPMGGKVKLVISRQEEVSKTEDSPETDDVSVNNPRLQSAEHLVIENEKQVPQSQGVDHSSIFPWRQKEILTFDIPVHDTEKAGLGISVKGKTSTSSAYKQGLDNAIDMGIFINSILHGGAASRDGRLKTNDQLLNVNGVSLLGQSNSNAMDTLRRAILHTEGPKPGAITLTVARKINSGYHAKHRRDSSSSLLTDSSASTETFGRTEVDSAPTTTSANNSGNSDASENTVIFVAPKSQNQITPIENSTVNAVSSRNPVLERLTGQVPLNHNALRNESYYRATHHATMVLMNKDCDRLTSPTVNQSPNDMVIIEEDTEPLYNPPTANEFNNVSNIVVGQQRGSTSTQATDATYCSQLSLDDAAAGFSRDAFGRQSMSEKRHATLDAKSTDTYQKNKKLREEREKQRLEKGGMVNGVVIRVNSTESIPRSDNNDIVSKKQLGPSLGMKKSSSLESLQTMVQEIQMAEDCGVYRRNQAPVRVVRGRGCNESFRAAVDKSYEGRHYQQHTMETLPEDDGSGGCQFMPRQSSLNSQLDCKLMKHQQQHAHHKKKSSILKGLGSMFRFGRHRKPAILENIPTSNSGATKSMSLEEEKELARRAAIDEQQRIQEQYKILIQRQMEMHHQQQQQQKIFNQPYNREMTLPNSNTNCNGYNNPPRVYTNNMNNKDPVRNDGPMQNRKVIQTHKSNYDRGSHYVPQDKAKEDCYNAGTRQSFRQSEFEPRFNNTARLSGRQVYTSSENNRYSHYVNYEEIQQQMNRRQQQHYHSQRRNSRELPHRPVSNFYEYESVQAVIQNTAGSASSNTYSSPPGPPSDINCNSLPRTDFYPPDVYNGSGPARDYHHQSTRMYPTNNSNSHNNNNNNNNFPQIINVPSSMGSFHRRRADNHQSQVISPLYSNLPSSIGGKLQGGVAGTGPYITQVTITDNSHYSTTSLGTKV